MAKPEPKRKASRLEGIDVKRRPLWSGKLHLEVSYDEMRAMEAICRKTLGNRRRVATECLLAGLPIVAARFGVKVNFK